MNNTDELIFLKTTVLTYKGNECLLWPYKSRRGVARGDHPQPAITIDGKLHTVARLVCEYFHGKPADGQVVCHDPVNCNNPRCVSGNHLRWGSRSDNEKDKNRAGTWRTGSTKLSKLDVWKIHTLRDNGLKHAEIAEAFLCNRSHVTDILNGRRHHDVYLQRQEDLCKHNDKGDTD